MSFRARIALLAAAAVSVTVVLASALVYVVLRSELRDQVDDGLRQRVDAVRVRPRGHGFSFGAPFLGGPAGYVQLVPAEGPPVRLPGATVPLPSTGARLVAAGVRDEFFEDAVVDGVRARVLTTRVRPGLAVQIARPLDEVDRILSRLVLLLAAISLGGIALAAAAGVVVAGPGLRPLRRLTAAAEHVRRTQDLSQRIEARNGDELGRLAESFNEMLGALEESVKAQRRLVADASHELRTPLTSLRTNIQVLATVPVKADERRLILADVEGQIEELSVLVAQVVELARGDEPRADPEPVQLDALTAAAVERVRRRGAAVEVRADLEPSVVRGVPDELERAVANLLDNAVKWSRPGGEVEVAVRGGEVVVRDYGPGIAAADLPHVFERFYRAPAARGVPGSGLGLAIVKQVAERHGGTVSAEHADGGGARLRLLIPAAESPSS